MGREDIQRSRLKIRANYGGRSEVGDECGMVISASTTIFFGYNLDMRKVHAGVLVVFVAYAAYAVFPSISGAQAGMSADMMCVEGDYTCSWPFKNQQTQKQCMRNFPCFDKEKAVVAAKGKCMQFHQCKTTTVTDEKGQEVAPQQPDISPSQSQSQGSGAQSESGVPSAQGAFQLQPQLDSPQTSPSGAKGDQQVYNDPLVQYVQNTQLRDCRATRQIQVRCRIFKMCLLTARRSAIFPVRL